MLHRPPIQETRLVIQGCSLNQEKTNKQKTNATGTKLSIPLEFQGESDQGIQGAQNVISQSPHLTSKADSPPHSL